MHATKIVRVKRSVATGRRGTRARLLRLGAWLAVWGLVWLAVDCPTRGVLRGDETSPAEAVAGGVKFDEQAIEFFEKQVRPVLVQRCFECHSGETSEPKGGLRLDSRAATLAGGDTGPAIVPGKPKGSLLIDAINHGELYQMPPKGKLPAREIEALTRWVEMGAPWPAGTAGSSAEKGKAGFDLAGRKASHWAWRPIVDQAAPRRAEDRWSKSEIDRFVFARLEERGLSPAPAADPRILIRRAYMDLIGLPPPPEAVEAFVADGSDGGFEGVVDTLLASPRFGERWGRHWLDLVRYAETYGHEFDYPIEGAWRYRDYVIRALNADVPYDRFAMEQIAGDLLPDPRLHPSEGYNESILGTGFWFFGEQTHAPVDVRMHEADRVDNQVDVLGKTFLGLTLGCARCHDHKFDAISQRDVYSLWGFVKSSRQQRAWLDPGGRIGKLAAELAQEKANANGSLGELLVRGPTLSGEELGRYLLAAREVARREGGANLEVVARERGLDADRLKAWLAVFQGPAADGPGHPLWSWKRVGMAAGEDQGEPFAAAARQAAAQVESLAQERKERQGAATLFADFEGEKFGSWFVSGEAFGSGPTRRKEWNSHREGGRTLAPGEANSGRLSTKLRGALRSPTFTISGERIFYRLAGKNARVRLIVDGYRMDEFSALLFSGFSFAVNNETPHWHEQGGDLSKYQGHRGYLELLDEGDGWLAVDEIRFAKAGWTPPPEVNGLNAAALADPAVDSVQALAGKLGALWEESLRAWQEGRASESQDGLVRWMIEQGFAPAKQAGVLALDEQLTAARSRGKTIEEAMPEPIAALAIADGTGQDERVYVRGNPKTLGEAAPRRFLEAIAGSEQPTIQPDGGSGRLELARRIVDPANPFFARVAVNRIWQHLFGRGIVGSVDNFGALGEAPTHPELLDHLASRFIADGYSVKRLIRTIMLSSAYRMSSRGDSKGEEFDPDNKLLHRQRVRRLEGEAIRDALLALSGRLDTTSFGPPVPVHLTEFMEGRGRPGQSGPLDGNGRRSIYLEVRRNFPVPMFAAFDTPTPFSTVGRRNVSNVPAQALIMMNDPLVLGEARRWMEREWAAAAEATAEQRIDRLYVQAFARPATERERKATMAFFRRQAAKIDAEAGAKKEMETESREAWVDFCHALINSKQFVFVE